MTEATKKRRARLTSAELAVLASIWRDHPAVPDRWVAEEFSRRIGRDIPRYTVRHHRPHRLRAGRYGSRPAVGIVWRPGETDTELVATWKGIDADVDTIEEGGDTWVANVVRGDGTMVRGDTDIVTVFALDRVSAIWAAETLMRAIDAEDRRARKGGGDGPAPAV